MKSGALLTYAHLRLPQLGKIGYNEFIPHHITKYKMNTKYESTNFYQIRTKYEIRKYESAKNKNKK